MEIFDVVVNNIDDPVLVYENKSNDRGERSFARVRLTGSAKNRNAVGARIVLFTGENIRTYEKYPVKRLSVEYGRAIAHRSIQNKKLIQLF